MGYDQFQVRRETWLVSPSVVEGDEEHPENKTSIQIRPSPSQDSQVLPIRTAGRFSRSTMCWLSHGHLATLHVGPVSGYPCLGRDVDECLHGYVDHFQCQTCTMCQRVVCAKNLRGKSSGHSHRVRRHSTSGAWFAILQMARC